MVEGASRADGKRWPFSGENVSILVIARSVSDEATQGPARRPLGCFAPLAMTNHESPRKGRLPDRPSKLVAIQLLRGAAAIAVALIHLEPEIRARAGLVPGTRPFPFEAGVDVFFVISGFVMVYASGNLFARAGAARTFLARRLARIAPLYWLTTTVVLALLAIRPDLLGTTVATPGLVIASYLFIPIARPDGLVQPVYSLGWTLNYEMFFYVLFGLAIGWPRRRAVATVCVLIAALIGAGLAFAPLPQPFGFWTDTIMVEFALGMGIGLLRQEGRVLPAGARIGLAAVGLALFWAIGGDAVTRTGLNQALLFGLPSACLVAACGLAPGHRAGEPEPWLVRGAEAVGDASYAIYLLHPFAIRGTARLIDASGLAGALGATGFAAAALAATLLVALASYRIVERPLTRLARRALEPTHPPSFRGLEAEPGIHKR